MSKKKTTEQFIEEARKVHGDSYDYSKAVYVNAKTKVCIICPEHGEFWQTIHNHLYGKGCQMCAIKKRSEKTRKWTYEKCYEEAKKYKTKKDFNECNSCAYNAAYKNRWLKDYTWFEEIKKPKDYWTYEKCYEEAKKYKTSTEFVNGSNVAYGKASRNKWLDDYTWFIKVQKPSGYWTYEKCYEEAKKYKTRNSFSKGSSVAYNVARKNKWLDYYTWFVDGNKLVADAKRKWTYETCYGEAKEYETRKGFQNGSKCAYNVARKNKWLDDYTWMINGKIKLFTDNIDSVYVYIFEDNSVYVGRTLMKCQNDRHKTHKLGRLGKYAYDNGLSMPKMKIIEDNLTITEGLIKEDYWVNWYKENGYKVLNIAKTGVRSGSLGGIDNGKWTYKTCYEEAKKYKTKKDFKSGSNGAYDKARRNKWLDDYTWFIINWVKKWTYEKCYEEAKKYKTKKDFKSGSKCAYDAARRNKWLDDYTWLNRIRKPNGYWTYEKCYEEAKKYNTKSEFGKGNGSAYTIANRNKWLDIFFS